MVIAAKKIRCGIMIRKCTLIIYLTSDNILNVTSYILL